MNDELIFPASLIKALLGLIGSLAFVALAFPLASSRPILAWLAGSFFMLCAVVYSFNILTNLAYIKLTPEGLYVSTFFGKRHHAWSDLEPFFVSRFIGVKTISVSLRSGKPRGVFTSTDIGNHYRASAESICSELNRWREHYGRAKY